MYIYTYIYIYIHTYAACPADACPKLKRDTYVYTYIYIYICICIHTYVYVYIIFIYPYNTKPGALQRRPFWVVDILCQYCAKIGGEIRCCTVAFVLMNQFDWPRSNKCMRQVAQLYEACHGLEVTNNLPSPSGPYNVTSAPYFSCSFVWEFQKPLRHRNSLECVTFWSMCFFVVCYMAQDCRQRVYFLRTSSCTLCEFHCQPVAISYYSQSDKKSFPSRNLWHASDFVFLTQELGTFRRLVSIQWVSNSG